MAFLNKINKVIFSTKIRIQSIEILSPVTLKKRRDTVNRGEGKGGKKKGEKKKGKRERER